MKSTNQLQKMGFCAAAPTLNLRSSPSCYRKKGRIENGTWRIVRVKAKLFDENGDRLLKAAIDAGAIRFREAHQPDPLFHDLYAGCFLTSVDHKDMEQYPSTMSTYYYCLATKFIDDKLIRTTNCIEGSRQVVLFSDGMDTRPYRLSWPSSTIIFDISLGRIFEMASQRLEGVGAKIPKTCLFFHIPFDSSGIQGALRSKGFDGSKPSIWAFQGLPVTTLSSFEEVLSIVSSFAMKGCIFVGEFPLCSAETDLGSKSQMQRWMDKLFMSNGFRVDVLAYDEVARNFGRDPPSGYYGNVLFVAQQLQLSDDQVENWRREFQRAEDDGDEDGFEDLM